MFWVPEMSSNRPPNRRTHFAYEPDRKANKRLTRERAQMCGAVVVGPRRGVAGASRRAGRRCLSSVGYARHRLDPATSGGSSHHERRSGHHSHGSGCGEGAPPGGPPPPLPGCGGGAAREREGGREREAPRGRAVLLAPWWRKSATRCSPSRARRAPRAVLEKERRGRGEGAPPCFVLRPARAMEGRGEGVGI